MKTTLRSGLMAASLATAFATQGIAQAETAEATAAQPKVVSTDDWSYAAALYGWIAEIEGTTSGGDDITVSFSDILDNLKMTFMGSVLAKKGKFSIFSDLIYLKLGTTERTTANIIGRPAEVKAKIEIKNWINTTGVTYELMNNGSTQLLGLGGMRYLKLDADIDFDIGPVGRNVSSSEDYFDGLIGIRGSTDLSDDWYMTYYADIGTGQSELTYQLFAGVNYRFKKWDAVLGYRYLHWELDGDVVDDLTVKGPLIGARFRF